MTCHCAIDDFKVKHFSSLLFNEKIQCLEKGRPTPELTLEKVRSNKTFKFQKSWYNSNPWLSGCATTQAMYCWPCLLFSSTHPCKFSQLENGVTDVSNYSILKQRHNLTKDHIASVVLLAKFGKVRIETAASSAYKINIEKHNETVRNNRYVVSRLIDVICLLAKQELPFRGHSEGTSSSNRGNYLEFLYFLAQTDVVLAEHLKSATVFSGTSPDIQNDLIEAIATVILQNIKKDIAESNFVSIILDETTDISHKCQLSTVFRYKSQNKIQERFIKFENVSSDRSAQALFELLIKTLQEFDCKNKLICQTYDGAAVMAGAHNGLQKLVRDECPSAIFVHCYAHKLNLVLQQSCNSIKSCKVFFQTCSGFAAFFSKSAGRSAALEEVVKRKFPTVAPTRWYYTHRLISVLSQVHEELKTLLTDMSNNIESWDVDTRMAATGFLHTMEKQEFKFLLKLFSLIFPKAEVLFNVLQKKSFDISFCNKKIESFKSEIMLLKSSFHLIWNSVVDTDSPPARQQRVDYVIDEETSYRALSNEIIDNIAVRIRERFDNIKDLEFLALLDSEKFETFTTSFPDDAFLTLKNIYGDSFEMGILKIELQVMYSDTDCYKRTLSDLFEYFLISGLDNAIPQVFKLIELCLCIPATSAAVERSFSCLKRIHTYQRNTQVQDRKSHLGLISMEKEYLNTLRSSPLFHGQIIDVFKAKKERRLHLDFK